MYKIAVLPGDGIGPEVVREGLKVIKAVIKYDLDALFTSRIGEISFYMLKDNFVDIYKIEEGITVKEVIKGFHEKQLEEILAPTHPVEESMVEKQ